MPGMRRRERVWVARWRGLVCQRHNTPLMPSPYFYGWVCSLGCRHSATVREWELRRAVDMRRWYGRNGWEHT
jgi:hypothetical protein